MHTGRPVGVYTVSWFELGRDERRDLRQFL